ncbi:MAG: hypothetical protein ACR2JO_08075 [Mycobacteriales bacterium]
MRIGDVSEMAALMFALGRLHQAMSEETVLAMTDAEARAYVNLQDAMRRVGAL